MYKFGQLNQKMLPSRIFLLSLLISCSHVTDRQTPHAGLLVTPASLREPWPLTVDKAYVECLDGRVAVLHADGKTYALNGTSKAHGYPDLEPIWRENPDIPGTRISIAPLIALALEQCR